MYKGRKHKERNNVLCINLDGKKERIRKCISFLRER